MTKTINPKIKELADKADLIIHGFAFYKEDNIVKVINLHNLKNTAVLSLDGKLLETTMTDIEAKIVVDYYAKNKKYIILSKEIFENVLEKNISANPDLPVKFIKDILIAKKQSMKPFDMEPEE